MKYRTDVINFLIEKHNFKTYLEIGLGDGVNYRLISCESKECCEPYPKVGLDELVTYRMKSDDMFSSTEKKWDIIFIDGLHTEEMSGHDIVNSLKHLNPGGKIVIHDSLPSFKEHATPEYNGDIWNGEVYKSIINLKKFGIRYYTISTDYGCCVVDYFENSDSLGFFEKSEIDFDYFDANRFRLMNVIDEDLFFDNYDNVDLFNIFPTTLSTCLIVKNESVCIEKCLNSISSFSDEIIIYDTGSNDGTQDICRQNEKVRLIQGEWKEDFAWARNQSFKYATCDYIMWVDADDVISEESQKWIKDFKDTELKNYTQVDIEYIYDMEENGKYSMHFYRERIFRRTSDPKWFGRIHEYPMALNRDNFSLYEVPFSEAFIMHFKHSPDPARNIRIYRDMEKNGEMNSGRDWFYYARECMWQENGDVAIEKFKRALDCDDLWIIDRLNAHMGMAWLYKQQGNFKEYVEHTFLAAACTKMPRPDVLCELAEIYKGWGNRKLAKNCLLLALEQNGITGDETTFMTTDKCTIWPALELCLLEYEDGNIEEAKKYNEIAYSFDPENPSVKHNVEFFKNI